MKDILKENKVYVIGFALLFLIGCIKRSMQEKGDLVLYFAKLRAPSIDQFFLYCTQMGEEWIYVVAVLLLAFYRFRYALMVPFIGFFVLLISTSLKRFFGTPRPRTFFYELFDNNEIINIQNIDLFVGYTSFPSGHSMSGFAIFTFMALCIPNRIAKLLMLVMASLVAFSRIVITQHFLEDILAGSLLGFLLAFFLYYLQKGRYTDAKYWFNSSLRPTNKEIA